MERDTEFVAGVRRVIEHGNGHRAFKHGAATVGPDAPGHDERRERSVNLSADWYKFGRLDPAADPRREFVPKRTTATPQAAPAPLARRPW